MQSGQYKQDPELLRKSSKHMNICHSVIAPSRDKTLQAHNNTNSRGTRRKHTLKCLICSIITILIRVSEQAQFPVCLLDFILAARLLQREDLVVSVRAALAHPDYSCFLFGCVGARRRAVVVLVAATLGIAVVRARACCFGRHNGLSDKIVSAEDGLEPDDGCVLQSSAKNVGGRWCLVWGWIGFREE